MKRKVNSVTPSSPPPSNGDGDASSYAPSVEEGEIATPPPPKAKRGNSKKSSGSKKEEEASSSCKTPSPKGKKGSASNGASPKSGTKGRPWLTEEDGVYIKQLLFDESGKPKNPDHRKAQVEMDAIAKARDLDEKRTYDAVRVHWQTVRDRILAIGGLDVKGNFKATKNEKKDD